MQLEQHGFDQLESKLIVIKAKERDCKGIAKYDHSGSTFLQQLLKQTALVVIGEQR